MPKQLDLGAFLSEQTSDGIVDSRGEFTVSHTQAARKLAKFALPRDSAWVTKLVQAANRWNCGALQVRQSATETLFHFTMPSLGGIPTEDAIVSGLLSGKVGGQEALDAFCMALRALVEQARLSFILVADDTHLAPRPIYAGQYYGEISEKARLHKRFNPKPGITLTVYHRPSPQDEENVLDVISRLRGYVHIIDELDTYCFMSRVPILLDGRRVDSLVSSPGLGLSHRNRPLLFLGVKGLRHSPTGLPTPEDFEEKVLSLLSHPRRVARDYGGEREFQAVFLLAARTDMGLNSYAGKKKLAQLIWVNDGVVVQKEALQVKTIGLGLTVFANAHDMDTDLTGFTLLEREEFQRRRREVLLAVGKALGSQRVSSADFFHRDRDLHSPKDEEFDQQEEVRRRIKILVRGSGTGLTLTLFNPVLGISTTLAAMAAAYVSKPHDQQERILSRRESLQKAVATDLTVLREFLITPELL